MKHLRLFFISLLPFTFLLLPSFAALRTASDSRLAVFDDVWETVRERYYDPTFHGLDWETERARFRPLAESAQTTQELYNVIRSMLSDLKDAHTRVFAPDERFDWQHPRFISVGIAVREVGGLPVVVSVEQGSDAEREGVRAGDVVTKIDGEDALDVFARRLKEQAGSSTPAAARLQAMAKLFEGKRDTALNISWIDFDGKERTATLKREWRERDTGVRVRRVGKVGIVEFDVFTQASAVDFIRALTNRLRGVRGLIIDLRNNGGGEADAMAEVASAFLPQGVSLGHFTDRSHSIQFEPHTHSNMLYTADAVESVRAPLVILTSGRTSSAAEIFVAAMREARRAFTVGQTTCGCVLAIRRRHILPDGGELDVSEMDYFTAEGKRLEGEGITPDLSITLDRQDLRAHRDRAMERAIERLERASINR
ncbi:MAG TPA: S41 family peptidase [Pyrinomonadaceae bacterium]|nr:S41 family peptidase [Pyrinomonadaceae bacterium]